MRAVFSLRCWRESLRVYENQMLGENGGLIWGGWPESIGLRTTQSKTSSFLLQQKLFNFGPPSPYWCHDKQKQLQPTWFRLGARERVLPPVEKHCFRPCFCHLFAVNTCWWVTMIHVHMVCCSTDHVRVPSVWTAPAERRRRVPQRAWRDSWEDQQRPMSPRGQHLKPPDLWPPEFIDSFESSPQPDTFTFGL